MPSAPHRCWRPLRGEGDQQPAPAARWRTPLVIQAACLQAAWVGARLMIGYRALGHEAGALGLGVVAASFALPALLTALRAGRISDRVGEP